MNKIASPDELRGELSALLDYSQKRSPSRARIASRLRVLAEGVDKTAASKAWGDVLLDWISDIEKEIAKVVTSSKGFKVTSDRGQRNYENVGWAHRFSGETSEGIADVDISVFWRNGVVQVFGSYHAGAHVEPIFGSGGVNLDFNASPAKIVAIAKKFFSAL